MIKNYYSVLQIPAESTPVEIRAAYLNLSRRQDPRFNTKYRSTLRQRVLDEAFHVLSDPVERANHDLRMAKEQSRLDDLYALAEDGEDGHPDVAVDAGNVLDVVLVEVDPLEWQVEMLARQESSRFNSRVFTIFATTFVILLVAALFLRRLDFIEILLSSLVIFIGVVSVVYHFSLRKHDYR